MSTEPYVDDDLVGETADFADDAEGDVFDAFDVERLVRAAAGGFSLYVNYGGNLAVGTALSGGMNTARGAALPVPRIRSGVVHIAEVDEVVSVFAEPRGYLAALRVLRHGMVVLGGEAGSGRRTAAIHMLDYCRVKRIVALDPDSGLARLTSTEGLGSVQERTGYLLELDDATALAEFGSARLASLAAALDDAGSCLAVTAEARTIPEGVGREFAVALSAPDPWGVVDRRLCDALGDTWAETHPQFAEERVRTAAAACHGPAQAAVLAADLLGVARGRYDVAQVLAAVGRRGRDAVADWFAAHPEPEDWALVIAAAVFEGHDYSMVDGRATALLNRIVPRPAGTEHPRPTAAHSARPRSARLQAINAEPQPEPTIVPRRSLRYRVEPVGFTRPHWAEAVLDHVWTEYPQLRTAVLDWLADTPDSRDMRDSAARVAGRLIGQSSGFRSLAPLGRWARRDAAHRRLAALALGVAATDEVTATQVRQLLARWARADTAVELQLTAAYAYGGPFGMAYPATALRRLTKLARSADGEVAAAAAQGVVNLCRSGTSPSDVVGALHRLLADDPGAAGAVGGMLRHLVRTDMPRTDGGGPPVALGPLLVDPASRALLRELVAALARSRAGYGAALDTVADWLRAGASSEPHDRATVQGFLADVFGADRRAGVERLAYDLICLAYEDARVDLDILQPALDVFEEPLTAPQREGGFPA